MYKKMYFRLFNTITDALEENNINILKEILKNGQIETEEMYVSQEQKIAHLSVIKTFSKK